jgi:hypothetical protein
VRRAVAEDFDTYLDAPGEVSDLAIDALLDHLGVPVPPCDEMDRWAVRVDAAAGAGAARLVDALSVPGLRRIAAFVLRYCDSPPPEVEVDDPPTRLALHIARGVHHGWSDGDDLASFGTAFGALLRSRAEPGMLGALLSCTGEPGAVLTALPWAEPGWDTPVQAVDDLLHRVPHLHVEWLRAMAPNPLLADSAARTRDLSLVAAYVLPLLHHENVEVRRAAIRRLTSQWRTAAAQDAVAALLDSDLADEVADKLASLRDDRCLPRLVARVRAVRGLAAAQPFGAELLPEVLRVLTGPLAPREISALLTQPWGVPPLLMRPEAAASVDRLAAVGTEDAQ